MAKHHPAHVGLAGSSARESGLRPWAEVWHSRSSVRDGADQQLRRRYAELRMISRASRRSVEFLFAPSAIPCIKRSKLSVASRSTACVLTQWVIVVPSNS
jgi:hypothetical protein